MERAKDLLIHFRPKRVYETAKDLLIHFRPERGYKLTELDVESVQENLNMYYEKLKEVKQNV